MILLKRGIAYSVDVCIISLILYPYFEKYGIETSEGALTLTGINYLPPIIIWYLYFIVSEYKWQTTIGKKVFSLYVRRIDSLPLNFSVIIKRRALDLVELFFMPVIALISVLVTSKNQRLGDLIAKTEVINIPKNK